MSFKNHIQEFGILWQTCILPYISMKPFEVEFPYKSLSNVFFIFFSEIFPLYPCWLIYRLFGAIFFLKPSAGGNGFVGFVHAF